MRLKVHCLVFAMLMLHARSLRGAELVLDTPQCSLGRVEAAGDITHEFPFRIEGDGALEITDVRGSCGCIAPSVSARRFTAGQRGVLTMGIHAASQKEGRRLYQITLSIRSGAQVSSVVATLDLDLYKPIVVEPSNLLIYVNGSRTLRQTITVTDQRPLPLELMSVSATSERLKPRVLRNPAADAAVRKVELSIDGEFPMGRSQEQLVIETADPRHDKIVVPVTIVRASRLKILPERLHGRRPKSHKPLTWQVLISDGRGEPIRIASVECTDPRVSVEWPRSTTPRCRLAVTVKPEGPEIETELIVHVVEPIATELYLPLKVD